MEDFKEMLMPENLGSVQMYMDKFKAPFPEAMGMAKQAASERLFFNGTYQVTMGGPHVTGVDGWPPMIHLSVIRRGPEEPISWDDLQEIKNKLISPQSEAIEVFPRESRLVNMGSNRHLWVFVAGFSVPIGWRKRMVKGEVE